MSYHDYDSSIEDSEPREGYEITLPAVTYRITSGDRDVVINGFTYKAYPAARGAIQISTSTKTNDLELRLHVDHPVVQRYLLGGIPPRTILVKVFRHQVAINQSICIWNGYVTSVALSGRIASLNISTRMGEAMARRLPTISAGKSCPHVLYDDQCSVSRGTYTVNTTVISISGSQVTVASIGGHPSRWAQWGEILHVPSGERMTITDQIGTVIYMQLPIAELQLGHVVQVFAGCAHNPTDCVDKFDNMVNYGGFPQMETHNPFKITGFGIYRSEV